MLIKGCYNQHERNFYPYFNNAKDPWARISSGVDSEKLVIQRMTRDFCRIKALESSTVEHVLENITGFDIAHFACHGSVDPEDPSNSHLLLQKIGPSGP